MKKDFKISVIIPIYNVEKYLSEAINSIINQSIGFSDNIQLILVNDGSPDNSEEICLKYKEKYPDNIIYIKQENSGVSEARNNGFKYATGKYINFLDSDDIWDKDAFLIGYKFLEENNDIDLTCFRLKFFEAQHGYHALDYKFKGNRVIDVEEEPNAILLHLPTALIRKSAIEDVKFDKRLKICEDTKFLYEVILKKRKYGAISSVNYNYRKRKEDNSALQNSRSNLSWYTNTLEYAHKELINLSFEKFGVVIPYVQYFIMYELQYRLQDNLKIPFNKEIKEQYINNIKYLLKYIDDEVISNQREINFNEKLLAYNLKYGNLNGILTIVDDNICINESIIGKKNDLLNIIKIFEIENKKLKIINQVSFIDEFEIAYEYNNEMVDLKPIYTEIVNNDFDCSLTKKTYRTELDLRNGGNLKYYIKFNNKVIQMTNLLDHYSKLSILDNAYYYTEKYLVTKQNDSKELKIERRPSKFKIFTKEIKLLFSILFKEKKRKAFIIRMAYWMSKPFIRKDIFIFSDREFMAEDSGEILFKYFNEHNKNKKIKTYFAIDKHYKDYNRMKKYGNVVSYHSIKYKLLFLHSKFIISSHADGYVNNEFGKAKIYYIDKYKFKYIYLTHGILLHDSSEWLNRINKNFALNVTTSPMEYDSIINGPYYFEEKELIKTGMPRYDNLINLNVEEENKILFMPSWRSKLVDNAIIGTQRRSYNPNFINSEYYQFYKKLLSEDKLLKILRKEKLTIKFCVHPSFRGQFKDFKLLENDVVKFDIDVNSQYETKTSKCIITDYSSAACDFAYLNKPVIYANFDYDHIFDEHYYNKGYFDYDKDGFGPNCTNYEDTLNEIIKLINNDFKVDKKYKERMQKFFFYQDNKNSERVYEKMMELYNNAK